MGVDALIGSLEHCSPAGECGQNVGASVQQRLDRKMRNAPDLVIKPESGAFARGGGGGI